MSLHRRTPPGKAPQRIRPLRRCHRTPSAAADLARAAQRAPLPSVSSLPPSRSSCALTSSNVSTEPSQPHRCQTPSLLAPLVSVSPRSTFHANDCLFSSFASSHCSICDPSGFQDFLAFSIHPTLLPIVFLSRSPLDATRRSACATSSAFFRHSPFRLPTSTPRESA